MLGQRWCVYAGLCLGCCGPRPIPSPRTGTAHPVPPVPEGLGDPFPGPVHPALCPVNGGCTPRRWRQGPGIEALPSPLPLAPSLVRQYRATASAGPGYFNPTIPWGLLSLRQFNWELQQEGAPPQGCSQHPEPVRSMRQVGEGRVPPPKGSPLGTCSPGTGGGHPVGHRDKS